MAWRNNKTLVNLVANMGKMGFEDKDIADVLGVHVIRLHKQLKKNPTLEAALFEGRSEATQNIVGNIYRTAMGGNPYSETVVKKTATGGTTTTITTKTSPPNAILMMFWATNRDPENWKHIRQMLKLEGKYDYNDEKPESDKIARLFGLVPTADSNRPKRKRIVSTKATRAIGEGEVDAANVCGDVQGKAADNVQDNVLDVQSKEGAKS